MDLNPHNQRLRNLPQHRLAPLREGLSVALLPLRLSERFCFVSAGDGRGSPRPTAQGIIKHQIPTASKNMVVSQCTTSKHWVIQEIQTLPSWSRHCQRNPWHIPSFRRTNRDSMLSWAVEVCILDSMALRILQPCNVYWGKDFSGLH